MCTPTFVDFFLFLPFFSFSHCFFCFLFLFFFSFPAARRVPFFLIRSLLDSSIPRFSLIFPSGFFSLLVNGASCANTHSAPRNINFFKPFPSGESSSSSDRRIAHFFMATEIQSREWEEKNKEQTNNMGLGKLKCKKL